MNPLSELTWLRTAWHLRQLERRPSAARPAGQPVFFHHIPKTAGTSLVQALRSALPAGAVLTDRGNMSRAFAERLLAAGVGAGHVVYGHPFLGAALPLRGRSRMVTLLREPRDHAVSNYLWVRARPELPDHALARATDLRGFLTARPYFILFQTASLYLAVAEESPPTAETVAAELPAVLAYLDAMALVGTTRSAAALFQAIAGPRGTGQRFPHRRAQAVPPAERDRMRAQYDALREEAGLAPLFAAEQATWAHAEALARRHFGAAA